jgi:alkylation response protein AidB-like acyl-CoA dehydrogenase
VHFDNTPADLIVEEGSAADAVAEVLDEAAVLLASESIGGAAALVEMAVEYATTRIQFGQPIGQFQAIQHRCADMYVDLELARSGVFEALHRDAATLPMPVLASIAKVTATGCYARVATQTLQVHGGTGFTWEHPVHWHLKRAKASQALLGTQSWHRNRIGVYLGMNAT